jgi:iron(III) transport system ATP-binding protein
MSGLPTSDATALVSSLSAAAALSIRDVAKSYGAVEALRGVSLDVPNGELICFLGPSGCGKTTLLRIIAGLEEVDRGRILLDGRDLSPIPARQRNFGMVFQSYSLFPNRTAARNVAYGLECRGIDKPNMKQRVADMLALVQLTDQADKLPAQMSGGQQQRVALARALAIDPAVLLLDEPLSALDARVREELRIEIRALQQRLGITTVMVTHDQEEALAIADRIVVMSQGLVEQTGTPRELYETPATAFVAGFVGLMNILPVTQRSDGALEFAGTVLTSGAVSAAQARLVAIRPEAVAIETKPGPGLPARIAQMTYLGNLTRFIAVPDAAPGYSVTIELHAGHQPLAIGTQIGLRFPAASLRVLA